MVLRAVSTRPLLPNLQSFAISDELQLTETAKIVDALACPTLVEICAPGLERDNGSVRSALSPRLMAQVAKLCPNIHRLELYTRGFHGWPHSMNTPGTSPSPSLITSLGQLHGLRTVGAGPEVLSSEMLMILGSLPSLESFMVYIPDDTPHQMIPDHLPPLTNSFPALRHFGLCKRSPSRVSQLWETLPFVQQLDSVSVKVNFDSDTSEDTIRNLVCSVCQFSPNITDLHFDFRSDDFAADSLELFTPAVIAHLKPLPLRRMRILTSGSQLLPPCDDDQLVLALTNVEYLDIEHCDFTYEGVEFVAKHMPRLKFLTISLNGPNWPSEGELPLSPASSTSVLCLNAPFTADTWFDEIDDVDDYVDSVSTALSRLWPNGVHCEFTEFSAMNACDPDVDALERINDAIKGLCSPNEFSTPDMYSASQWRYSNRDATSWLDYHTF